MTTVSKSDKLKTKYKTETESLMSNVTPARKLPATTTTTTASRTIKKSSSHLNEGKTVNNDKKTTEKSKLANTSNTTAKKAKIGIQRDRDRSTRIITGTSQTNKSGVGSISTTSQTKHVSLRAKQLSTTATALNKEPAKKSTTSNKTFNVQSLIDKKKVIQKKNAVRDTPHNVTVSSPPSTKRNNDSNSSINNPKQKVDTSRLNRKGSRTLAPDEIVVLKRDSAKMRNEEAIRKEIDRKLAISKREPVAFEVKFDEQDKRNRQTFENGKIIAVDVKQKSDEETIYSDDFESYESDFETGSSTNSISSSDTCSDKNCKISENDDNQENSRSQITSDESERDDDTEVTQKPILEIQTDKERKLDSGNYDTNIHKINIIKSSDPPLSPPHPSYTDNWETTSFGISEQMDSGISTGANLVPFSDDKKNLKVLYGGYRYFYEKPIISSRGCELITKIEFDILSFTLIELKPISYEIFMQTFGKINTNQNFTQTDHNQTNVEQQTEISGTRTLWTQHPPQFVLRSSNNCDKNPTGNQLVCGEDIETAETQISHCELEQNLNAMKQLIKHNSKRGYQNYQKRPINYHLLHSFLLRSSFLVDQILGSSKTNTKSNSISSLAHVNNDQVLERVCERSFYIETNFLNKLQTVKIFSNNKFNLLITVHESLPDTNVYSSDFTNLLMVWCTNTCDKPLRLLTTWSEVSKVEIPNDSSDIVVAALRDGSIALWDLRETHSFCSKLDGYLTHFAATQSIVPSHTVERAGNKYQVDLGACLDIKSFRSSVGSSVLQPTFPTTQFVSLHESGIVTVWTLVQISETAFNLAKTEQSEKLNYMSYSPNFTQIFDSLSPWARVKLLQSSTANIREYVETKSAHSQSRFDKTKDFFQKNIYSDKSLRELNEATLETPGRQGIRFTSLECGSENFFICTNRNFVLMCSKSLKMDKLKRIFIDDSQFLFPTALKLLNNEHFLAIGLCNGVVMVLNCQSDKITSSHKEELMVKSESSKNFDSATDSILNSSITSKSCAIQNILVNVEKSCEKIDSNRDYRPSTAAYISLIDSKRKPFELKIIDQQVIMSGSVLRRNLIQHLELSADGWYLFALSNGHLSAYDFYLEQELPSKESSEPGKIIDLTTGKCGCNENNLMILRSNTDLEVIILKQ